MVDLMRRMVPLLVTVLTISAGAAALAPLPAQKAPDVAVGLDATVTPTTSPMVQLAQLWAGAYTVEPAPEGLDPFELKDYWLHERQVHGRSIDGWIQWVQETYNADVLPDTEAQGDLVTATLLLNALVGSSVSPAGILDMQRQANALDPGVRAAFGTLVSRIATAYAAQLPLSQQVLSQVPADVGPHFTILTAAQREEMAARAAAIVAALNEFRAATQGLFPPAPANAPCPSGPLFSDPEGLVVLGDVCDNTYTRAGTFPDPILLVDPDGNDVYLNSAGGADPAGILAPNTANRLVLSVVHDLLGDDDYLYDGLPATVQGAGAIGAIGILYDVDGDDLYDAKMTRTNTISILAAIQFYFDGGGQGYGFGGYGLLLDVTGNDVYHFKVASIQGRHIWAFAQGFGAAGGLGISSDASGNDDWLSNGLGITGGNGFQGIYTQGVGFWAGVGIMTDTGLGNDRYHSYDNSSSVDYYAQGFGAFEGLGILYEDGGNDDYIAVEHATCTNGCINPALNCAYGTASLAGYGVMLDALGDDRYFTNTISPRSAHTMVEGFGGIGAGVGLFFDLEGVDQHLAVASGSQGNEISGRGVFEPGEIFENLFLGEGANVIGFYLDSGGVDTYQGIGQDNDVWAFGADVNAVPGV